MVTIGHFEVFRVSLATPAAVFSEAPMTTIEKNQANRIAVPAAESRLKVIDRGLGLAGLVDDHLVEAGDREGEVEDGLGHLVEGLVDGLDAQAQTNSDRMMNGAQARKTWAAGTSGSLPSRSGSWSKCQLSFGCRSRKATVQMMKRSRRSSPAAKRAVSGEFAEKYWAMAKEPPDEGRPGPLPGPSSSRP